MAEKTETRFDGFSGMVSMTKDEALAWDVNYEIFGDTSRTTRDCVWSAFERVLAEVAALRARVAELEAKS